MATAIDPLLASGESANPQTFNRYLYVLNNPLTLTDLGLQIGSLPTTGNPYSYPYFYCVYIPTFAPFNWFGGFGTNMFQGDGEKNRLGSGLQFRVTLPKSKFGCQFCKCAIVGWNLADMEGAKQEGDNWRLKGKWPAQK